jgi:hypothetical protein
MASLVLPVDLLDKIYPADAGCKGGMDGNRQWVPG